MKPLTTRLTHIPHSTFGHSFVILIQISSLFQHPCNPWFFFFLKSQPNRNRREAMIGAPSPLGRQVSHVVSPDRLRSGEEEAEQDAHPPSHASSVTSDRRMKIQQT